MDNARWVNATAALSGSWFTDCVFSRYEFAANEFVNAVEFVTLETQSNETGFKEFVAVATTLNRGEDLAVKGAVRGNSRFYLPNLLLTHDRRRIYLIL
jgi:hypothetical protein